MGRSGLGKAWPGKATARWRGCATPSAACHAGACAGVRGSSTRSQGEAGWGSSCWGRCGASRARRVAGQVVAPVYGPAIGRVQGGERLKNRPVAVL